ncbi:hypothetical protein Aph02nite_34040 [Actinoplanes philippinensis]|nr:hypothetical protein Aph02nite_34040 [Actinoplanes philippinensis]
MSPLDRWSYRAGVAFATVLTIGVSFLAPPAAAHAADPVRDPGLDRANVLKVWQAAGPMVQAAAEQALLGGDAEIEAFVTVGWQEPQKLDQQAAVQQMMAQGGPTVRAFAQQALDAADPNAVKTFLESGWVSAQNTDLRLRVNQMMAAGGPSVRAAAQKALDAKTPEAGSEDSDYSEDSVSSPLKNFVATGWQGAFETDQRMRVNQIMAAGGPKVKDAAQAALDAHNVDAYTEFIGSGWALATARDQEAATIADLTGSAIAAAERATQRADAAKEAAERTAAATAGAKAAAKTAADLAASAHGDAKLAAKAARQAATAATRAAGAAREAIGAANAASDAARSAAAAASRAAAAATRAGDAAADAYQAASAAVSKAGDAKTARTAAEKARNTAVDASTAAKAAGDAGNAAKFAAQQATDAANGAAVEATNAANAADRAADASGDASAEARRAHQQAAVARANASRSQKAAQASTRFANVAADAAATSAKAASAAAGKATAAATAAEKAADRAADAGVDANLATQHANAATDAANQAVAAVTTAQQVYEAAREADNARIQQIGEQADQAAVAAKDAFITMAAQNSAAMEEVAKRSAATNQLIAEVNAPDTPQATVLADTRRIALDLAVSGGPWTKQAAIAALGAGDNLAINFVRVQLPLAAAQDNRDKLAAIADADMGTGSTAMKAAAAKALAGSDNDVAAFLRTGAYPLQLTELRRKVNQAMAAAVSAGNQTVVDLAQIALDDGSLSAMTAFLNKGQDAALATDERMKVNRILAAAGENTKLQVLAQAALDGPRAMQHQFLTLDQYTAAQDDEAAAQHAAEMAALISHAQQIVQLGVQKANTAQKLAATARGDAKAAGVYAQQANTAAGNAASEALKAQASAQKAQASADRAAASAKSARDAAQRAAASAHDAERSAMWADQSARRAAASARSAQADANRAHNAAVAAGKDAQAAVNAANEAINAANAKATAEQEAARNKMREQCRAYLQDGVPNGKDSYNKCLDMVAMTDEQRAALAARNAASCQTLFPNHDSNEFNNCLQSTLDPAFDTDQAMIVKQMQDADKHWWDDPWKVAAVVVVGVAVVGCALIPPCAGFLAVGLELATAFIAPEMIGVTAAIGGTEALLIGGGAAAGLGMGAYLQTRVLGSRAWTSAVSESRIGNMFKGEGKLPSCLTHNSFSAGTAVLMADGTSKPIADIQLNDRVLSTDPTTGKSLDKPVTELFVNSDTDLTDLTIQESSGESATLHTTTHHPFWNTDTGTWTDAGALTPGTNLHTPEGHQAQVTAANTFTGRQTMHNLSIADLHTYYVLAGKTPVLVHNCDTVYENLALGLRKRGLREFADEKEYTHFLDDTMEDALANVRDIANNHPKTEIHVRLDGFTMSNGRANATPAELFEDAYLQGGGNNWFTTQREMNILGRAVRLGNRDWSTIKFTLGTEDVTFPRPAYLGG